MQGEDDNAGLQVSPVHGGDLCVGVREYGVFKEEPAVGHVHTDR